MCDFQQITLYGSKMWTGGVPKGTEVTIEGASKPGVVHGDGMLLYGNDGKMVTKASLNSFLYEI